MSGYSDTMDFATHYPLRYLPPLSGDRAFHIAMDRSFQMSGREVASLMRKYGVTLSELKKRTGIPLYRLRTFRTVGMAGLTCCDIYQAITGSLSPRMAACFRSRWVN